MKTSLRRIDCILLIARICIYTTPQECDGKIIFPPSNKAAITFSEVVLECKTDRTTKIKWAKIYKSSSLSTSDTIYDGTAFTGNFSQTYNINRTMQGQYDLSMKLSLLYGRALAGRYSCEEPGGEIASAELIVLAANPTCFVSSLTKFSVSLQCRLRFRGHWIPEMEWKQEFPNGTIDRKTANTEIHNEAIVSKLTAAAENFRRKFICTIKFTAAGRPASTNARNIPDYEYNYEVFVNAIQHPSSITTATDPKSLTSTVVDTDAKSLTSTVVDISVYKIPLLIGSVILSVLLVFLVFLFFKRHKIANALRRRNIQEKIENTAADGGHIGSEAEANSRIIYEEVSDGNVVLHLPSNKVSSEQKYINTVPQSKSISKAQEENDEYMSLEGGGQDLQQAVYATLVPNSKYENWK